MDRRYFNQSQPQTMQIAVILLYVNAVLTVVLQSNQPLFQFATSSVVRSSTGVTRLVGTLLTLAYIVASAVAAYLIANEKRIGYRLGIAAAAAPLVATLIVVTIGFPGRLGLLDAVDLSLLFDVALLALLLHTQTRTYEKTWFK